MEERQSVGGSRQGSTAMKQWEMSTGHPLAVRPSRRRKAKEWWEEAAEVLEAVRRPQPEILQTIRIRIRVIYLFIY